MEKCFAVFCDDELFAVAHGKVALGRVFAGLVTDDLEDDQREVILGSITVEIVEFHSDGDKED